jgi:DNA polymerase-3 subunit alpha
VAGCEQNGVPKDVATQYWEKFVVPFANYGFNKAHALAYAYNSYITAFLKANYPEEFMCAYLNVETERRKLDRTAELEKEAQRMGIVVLPRDINKSTTRWEIVKKKDLTNGVFNSELRPPIHCKGLPVAAGENIVANRPYASIRDFAQKTDSSLVDKESIIALCDAKFFKTKRDTLMKEFEIIREDLKNLRKRGRESGNIFDEI